MFVLGRKRFIAALCAVAFLVTIFSADLLKLKTSDAASLGLPEPSQLLKLSGKMSEPSLRGIKVDPDNPFEFQFLFDTNDKKLISQEDIKRNVNYFFAGLSVDETDIWVNLSPYESDRILADTINNTELGRDLLKQDYLLKQIGSSLTHPETNVGNDYWQQIKRESNFDDANKLWITPDKAAVYVENNTALISHAALDVVSERDYFSETELTNLKDSANHSLLNLIRDDVNKGARFSELRQIYNALILSSWFKKYYINSHYNKLINKQNIADLDNVDPALKTKVFKLYCESFKTGVYDYVKKNEFNGAINKKRFVSGGFALSSSAVNKFEVIDASKKPEKPNGSLFVARYKLLPKLFEHSISKRLLKMVLLANLSIFSFGFSEQDSSANVEINQDNKLKVEFEYSDTLGWRNPEFTMLSPSRKHRLKLGSIFAPYREFNEPNFYLAYAYKNQRQKKYWDSQTAFQFTAQLSKNVSDFKAEILEQLEQSKAIKEAEIDSLIAAGGTIEADTTTVRDGIETRFVGVAINDTAHLFNYTVGYTDVYWSKKEDELYGDDWWNRRNSVDFGLGLSFYKMLRFEHQFNERLKFVNAAMANANIHPTLIDGNEGARLLAPAFELNNMSSLEFRINDDNRLRLLIGNSLEGWPGNFQSSYVFGGKFYLGHHRVKLNFLSDNILGFKADSWFAYDILNMMRNDLSFGINLNKRNVNLLNQARFELPGSEGFTLKRFFYDSELSLRLTKGAELSFGLQYQRFAQNNNLQLRTGLRLPIGKRVSLESNFSRNLATDYKTAEQSTKSLSVVPLPELNSFERMVFFAMKDMTHSQRISYLRENIITSKEKLMLAIVLSANGYDNYDYDELKAFISDDMWGENDGSNNLSEEEFLSSLVDNYHEFKSDENMVCRHISLNLARVLESVGVESYIGVVLPGAAHTVNLFKIDGQLYVVNGDLYRTGTARVEKVFERYQANAGVLGGISPIFNSDGEYVGYIMPVSAWVARSAATVYDNERPLDILENFIVDGVDDDKSGSSALLNKITSIALLASTLLFVAGCAFDENIVSPDWESQEEIISHDTLGKDIPLYDESLLESWVIDSFFVDPTVKMSQREIVPNYDVYLDAWDVYNGLDNYSYKTLDYIFKETVKENSFVSKHAALGPGAMFAQTYVSLSDELLTGQLNLFELPVSLKKAYAFVWGYHDANNSNKIYDIAQMNSLCLSKFGDWIIENERNELFNELIADESGMFSQIDPSVYKGPFADSRLALEDFEIFDVVLDVDVDGVPIMWRENHEKFIWFSGIDYSKASGKSEFDKVSKMYNKIKELVENHYSNSLISFSLSYSQIKNYSNQFLESIYLGYDSILEDLMTYSDSIDLVAFELRPTELYLADAEGRKMIITTRNIDKISIKEFFVDDAGKFEIIKNKAGYIESYLFEPQNIFKKQLVATKPEYFAFMDGYSDSTVLARKSPLTGRQAKYTLANFHDGQYFGIDLNETTGIRKVYFNAATTAQDSMPIMAFTIFEDGSQQYNQFSLMPIIQTELSGDEYAWHRKTILPGYNQKKEFNVALKEFSIDIPEGKVVKRIEFMSHHTANVDFILAGLSATTSVFDEIAYDGWQYGDDLGTEPVNVALIEHLLRYRLADQKDLISEGNQFWSKLEETLTSAHLTQESTSMLDLELLAHITAFNSVAGSDFVGTYPKSSQWLFKRQDISSDRLMHLRTKISNLMIAYEALDEAQKPEVILILKDTDFTNAYPEPLYELFDACKVIDIKEIRFNMSVNKIFIKDVAGREKDFTVTDLNLVETITEFFSSSSLTTDRQINGGVDFTSLNTVEETVGLGEAMKFHAVSAYDLESISVVSIMLEDFKREITFNSFLN